MTTMLSSKSLSCHVPVASRLRRAERERQSRCSTRSQATRCHLLRKRVFKDPKLCLSTFVRVDRTLSKEGKCSDTSVRTLVRLNASSSTAEPDSAESGGMSENLVTAGFIALWNVVSLIIEISLLKQIYNSTEELQIPKDLDIEGNDHLNADLLPLM